MFESKNPFAPENAAHPDKAQADLRPVSWSELNARLAAAREFRFAFGEGDGEEGASFDAEIARQVAHLHETPEPNGKNRVNPDHSTHSKRTDGNTASRQENWRPATRGKE